MAAAKPPQAPEEPRAPQRDEIDPERRPPPGMIDAATDMLDDVDDAPLPPGMPAQS